MATEIVYNYVDLRTCGSVCKSFRRVFDKAYFKIKKISNTTAITIEDCTTISFLELNYYTLTFTVYPKGCPMANLPINLEQVVVDPGTVLTITQGLNTITISGVIPIGTKLKIYTNPLLLDYFECIQLVGTLGVSNVAAETNKITQYDINTKIRYIPSTPSVLSLLPLVPYPLPGVNPLLPAQYPVTVPTAIFPWTEAIIPWEQNQPFPVGPGLIITPPSPIPPLNPPYMDGYVDQYDKKESVPKSVIFYIGFDSEQVPVRAEAWTLFLTNFADRGYSDSNNNASPLTGNIAGPGALNDIINNIDTTNLKPGFLVVSDTLGFIQPGTQILSVGINTITLTVPTTYAGVGPSPLDTFTIVTPEWMYANYQKKVYMNALSLDKLQFYIPKIKAFANRSFTEASTYDKPLTSSFQANVVLFFLTMHIGYQDYPDYVIKWFSDFIKFVGIGDPSNPERAELLMYGNTTAPSIFEYFREKNIEVVANADKSTIAYWWAQAGLSAEALVFECVHNIVAFSQFSNVLYSVVYAGLHPVNPLSPLLPQYKNFLTEYRNAVTSNDKLNVVRESYRILVPNSVSFSLVKPVVPDVNVIKSRHFHQSIMVSNQPVPQVAQATSYFTYNPTQYNADFNTNLDNLVGLPIVTDILTASVTSELDQETVIDESTSPIRPIVPIFPKPIYAPFGLGYRRCAGEMLVYLVTEELFEIFSTVDFEERAGTFPLISIAPFKRVLDNIFVKQIV